MQPHLFQRRRFLASAGAAASVSITPAWAPAFGQTGDYPSKPITLVVGYPPGGSTDLTARLVGAELTKTPADCLIISPAKCSAVPTPDEP